MNIAHITIAGHYLQGGHQKKKKKAVTCQVRLPLFSWVNSSHQAHLCPAALC